MDFDTFLLILCIIAIIGALTFFALLAIGFIFGFAKMNWDFSTNLSLIATFIK